MAEPGEETLDLPAPRAAPQHARRPSSSRTCSGSRPRTVDSISGNRAAHGTSRGTWCLVPEKAPGALDVSFAMATRIQGRYGTPHGNPEDPPRRHANKKKGHGTYENDRPAVLGAMRRSGGVHLRVARESTAASLLLAALAEAEKDTPVMTDQRGSYTRLPSEG